MTPNQITSICTAGASSDHPHSEALRADGLYDGVYTKGGVPVCVGQVPMEYVGSDPKRSRLYRCRSEGCHLKESFKGGGLHCRDGVWEDPSKKPAAIRCNQAGQPALEGSIPAASGHRAGFKSMKESRRLERHCVRGLRQIRLHVLMSTLAFQATALVRVLAGEGEWMRWMVRKVA